MDSELPRTRAIHRRPPRASRACETCRVRKTKCDQAQPCSYCAYHCLDCVYRTGANQSTATPEKRHSRINQVQKGSGSRPSPWPGANQNTQLTQERERHSRSPNISFEDSRSPRISCGEESGSGLQQNHAATPITHGTDNRGDDSIVDAPLCDSASRDGLSGINLHTNGTEFYGNSSNLAFLGNLYARARKHAGNRALHGPGDFQSTAGPSQRHVEDRHKEDSAKTTDRTQLSIVNLLYNPSYQSHSPLQSPEKDKDKTVQTDNSEAPPNNIILGSGIAPVNHLPNGSQLEIEKIFISSYFSNKHYIHPMLCKSSFLRRCEREAFILSKRHLFVRGSSNFAGLYFAVVALGAINASPDETSLLDHYYTYTPDPRSSGIGSARGCSALDFANYYFGAAKKALGDVFESCSLESAQALMLLNVFCQNALRPHSCFMYSGMAVRTAVAIGLASGMSSLPANMRKEGKRTWWCIYSHEIEMCCSSGRLDSMKHLDYYQVPLPTLKTTPGHTQDPDAEDNDVAMIPVMVALAQIMTEASHHLYHSNKRSMHERSFIAMDLDTRLLRWKDDLPAFLNVDAASLNDPEWAFKQKLVLRLRFYNTRVLIHRPFLVASTSTSISTSEQIPYLNHIHLCLTAARSSIQMQYESFLHRIYIRTWWYNTTYALYSSMILLHLILAGVPEIPEEELLKDVEKSLDIFESMGNVVVARRCAEMIREVLDVTREYLRRRPAGHAQVLRPQSQYQQQMQPTLQSSILGAGPPTAMANESPALQHLHYTNAGTNSLNNYNFHSHPQTSIADLSPTSPDENFFFSLFGQEFQPNTRAEILANLVDPMILGDFAFGGGVE